MIRESSLLATPFILRNQEVLRIAKYWGVGRARRGDADSGFKGSSKLGTDSKL